MNLFAQCNEIVTVERRDGSRHEQVRVRVGPTTIIVPDANVPIGPSDVILRELPSGLVERLVITEPGFRAAFQHIPAHYQARYRHEGHQPARKPDYVVHVTGDNSRVNIDSTDNSVNVTSGNSEDFAKLAADLVRLRAALLPIASDAEHYIAIGALASAEVAAKEGSQSRVSQALSGLGTGGKWILDVAKQIGVPLAIDAIKGHLGLPQG